MNETPSPHSAEEKKAVHAGTGTIATYAAAFLILALLGTVLFMYRDIVKKSQKISSLQQENVMGEDNQKK